MRNAGKMRASSSYLQFIYGTPGRFQKASAESWTDSLQTRLYPEQEQEVNWCLVLGS